MRKGGRLPLSLTLCKVLGDPLPVQEEGVLLEAGGLLLQHLLVWKEFLPPVLLEVVVLGLVLEADLFGHIKWPFDPLPNFAGGC